MLTHGALTIQVGVVILLPQLFVTMVDLQWCLCVLSTLSLCSLQLGAGLLGCGTSGQILSRNVVLLPATSISASSSVSGYPATDVVNFGINEYEVWCTYNDAIDPYILLDFTSPVMITGLVSGGYNTDTSTIYVTEFTIEYSTPLHPDNFTFYSTSRMDGMPSNITVPAINTLVTLEEPFLAQRVRLTPTSWYDSRLWYICWSLLIFGCAGSEASEVCPQAPPPSHISPHPSSLPTATQTECTCPSSPTCSQATGTGSQATDTGDLSPQPQVVRDYQALAISLPIALITILITAAIVGVGVALCVRGTVRKKEPRPSPSWEPGENHETIRAVENVLYSTEKSPASIENGRYEVVELAHSKDAAERDSMVDNPSYYEIKH